MNTDAQGKLINNENNDFVMAQNNTTPFIASARLYRPKRFDDVIGQDAAIKALGNAMLLDRMPHAIILTGIRGTGKTTIARLLARAINCSQRSEGDINPCGECGHCQGMDKDSQMDVLEMDAASRTGIEDIREIIEIAQYKPLLGKYKIYIIDEIHMLSRSAFNGLLKTLEEPPAHVKFIFATTDIHKVPKTVLSRCMRFDLQRVSDEKLFTLFQSIAQKQKAVIDDEALHLIVNAAGGSARDGLSVLDQAILLGAGNVHTDLVRDMLGVVDDSASWRLLEALLQMKTAKALALASQIYDAGINPVNILADLAHKVHVLTSSLVDKEYLQSAKLMERREYIQELLAKHDMDIAVLSRYWQIIIKGVNEIKMAGWEFAAMRMVLIRVSFCGQLLTPHKIMELQNSNVSTDDENTMLDFTMESIFKGMQGTEMEQGANVFRQCVSKVLFDHDNRIVILHINNALKQNFGRDALMDLKKQFTHWLAARSENKWVVEINDNTINAVTRDNSTTIAQKDTDERNQLLEEFKQTKIGSDMEQIFGIEKIEIVA